MQLIYRHYNNNSYTFRCDQNVTTKIYVQKETLHTLKMDR